MNFKNYEHYKKDSRYVLRFRYNLDNSDCALYAIMTSDSLRYCGNILGPKQ
jgi:hypothetical protein